MLLNECKVLTDDCHLNDLFAELEKRYAGTLLCITTHSEPKRYLVYKEGSFDYLKFIDCTNDTEYVVFHFDENIEISIPKLDKGFYIYKNNNRLELAYITKNALRQWKRSICKNTYTLETVTEHINSLYFFHKPGNTTVFFTVITAILKEINNSQKRVFAHNDLKNHFKDNNFLLLSRDFILLKSLNTIDTYDLLYHKYWVGHTIDLKTLLIRDSRFKQEIHDLFNHHFSTDIKIIE